jgi:hypothetical protein
MELEEGRRLKPALESVLDRYAPCSAGRRHRVMVGGSSRDCSWVATAAAGRRSPRRSTGASSGPSRRSSPARRGERARCSASSAGR